MPPQQAQLTKSQTQGKARAVRTRVQSLALLRALEVAQTPQGIAEAVGITVEQLRKLLDSKAELPTPVFLSLIDIIARGRPSPPA